MAAALQIANGVVATTLTATFKLCHCSADICLALRDNEVLLPEHLASVYFCAVSVELTLKRERAGQLLYVSNFLCLGVLLCILYRVIFQNKMSFALPQGGTGCRDLR